MDCYFINVYLQNQLCFKRNYKLRSAKLNGTHYKRTPADTYRKKNKIAITNCTVFKAELQIQLCRDYCLIILLTNVLLSVIIWI